MSDLRIGVAVLAAGSSRRFGDADKLAQPFRGKRLGEHATQAITAERFAQAWVVTSQGSHPCSETWRADGFDIVTNPSASGGMGTSVALAAALAHDTNLDALLIALADMPLVPAEHFQAFAARMGDEQSILVSARDQTRLPPAMFGSAHFAELEALIGDKGARDLLAKGQMITCPPDWLIDIDTPEDLQKYGQAG